MDTIFGTPAIDWVYSAIEFQWAALEAVEVLEDLTEEGENYRKLYNGAVNNTWRFAVEANEICAAAIEAVEVLEDMYAQRDAEAERWYRQWCEEYDDHYRTRGALREAEAKVKELHETISTIIRHATIRQLAGPGKELEHERQPEFWYKNRNSI